ncbi:MAG: YCF48-related protein [Bacteroidota bacterium]
MNRLFFLTLLLGLSGLYSCGERLAPSEKISRLEADGPVRALHFFDANEGFVAGGERFFETILKHTADGGDNWTTRIPEPAFGQAVFGIDFWNRQRGVACGVGGKYLWTQDGGDTWRVVQSQYWRQMQDIAFADSQVVISVGGTGYSSGIMERSTNGGLNWALVDTFDFELRAVHFVDAQVGFACGYGVILKTSDSGLSWDFTEARREFFSDIDFPSSQVGYAVGRTGTILKTTDQGETWTRLRNGNLVFNPAHRYHAIDFVDNEIGYVAGDNGVLMKTTDGGKSWQKVALSFEQDWWDIQLLTDGKMVLGGADGSFLLLQE